MENQTEKTYTFEEIEERAICRGCGEPLSVYLTSDHYFEIEPCETCMYRLET